MESDKGSYSHAIRISKKLEQRGSTEIEGTNVKTNGHPGEDKIHPKEEMENHVATSDSDDQNATPCVGSNVRTAAH